MPMDSAFKRGLVDVSKSPEEMSGKNKEPDLKTLLNDTGKGLAKIAELMQSQPGLSESDRSQMQELLSQYVDFVESKLGGEGEEKESEPSQAEGQGAVPMEGGMHGKPMNMAMRQ